MDIPGYADAIARERFLRDAAFLGVTETVAGFELKPFQLRHYLLLRIAKNPMVYGDLPSPVELAQFLWIVSVDYVPGDARARARFLKRCRSFTPSPPLLFKTKRYRRHFERVAARFMEVYEAALAYVAEASMDCPPSRASGGFTPDYYSEVVFWLALFEHKYTPDQVLDMPMKVLFQCLNAAREAREKKPIMFNPSDRVRAQFMATANHN